MFHLHKAPMTTLRYAGYSFVLGLFFLPLHAQAQIKQPVRMDVQPKSYLCRYAEKPPMIDGKLDDAAWEKAPWTDDFVDIQGDLKPAPRFRTRAKLLWDDRNLYICAELEEPHVWGTLITRDAVIFQDNDFEVFIDPNGDNHEYFEFEMNALNTVWDLYLPKPYKDEGHAVNAWDIEGLRTAVKVNGTINMWRDKDNGWTLEIAMPWTAFAGAARIACPPHDGDRWRLNFSRVQWTTDIEGARYAKRKDTPEDNWVWSPQWVVDMHRPELWGVLQFEHNAAPDAKAGPDVDWPSKVALLDVYYAQRLYREATKKWATKLPELAKYAPKDRPLRKSIEIVATREGYTATLRGDGSKRWKIKQDSRLWAE